MTINEAIALVGVVRRGSIPQEMSDDRVDELAGYLVPLPFEFCRRAAERWCVSVPVDERGQPVPKFVNEPSAVLTACGVPIAARQIVDRALRDGGEVFPSVRGAPGDGGWEYVEAGAPLPRGVGEFYLVAGLPLPAGREVDPTLTAVDGGPAALPTGGEISEEQRRENLRRLGGLIREMGAKKAPAKGKTA